MHLTGGSACLEKIKASGKVFEFFSLICSLVYFPVSPQLSESKSERDVGVKPFIISALTCLCVEMWEK